MSTTPYSMHAHARNDERPGHGMDRPRATAGRGRRVLVLKTLVVLLLISAVAGAWQIVDRRNATGSAPEGLVYGEVVRGDVQPVAVGMGEFISTRQFSVSALESGVVEAVLHRPGDRVAQGDLLLRLHNPQLESDAEIAAIELRRAMLEQEEALRTMQREIDDAQSALLAAQLKLDIAQAELDAYAKLLDRHVVSDIAYRRIEAMAREAEHNLQVAERRVRESTEAAERRRRVARDVVELARTKQARLAERVSSLAVAAPADGYVKSFAVRAGDAATPGSALALIGPMRPDGARLRFPQHFLAALKPGLDVDLRFNATSRPGRVARVEPDLRDGYVVAEVAADDLPETARIDMAVRGEARLPALQDVLHMRSAYEAPPDGALLPVWRRSSAGHEERLLVAVASPVGGYLVFKDGVHEGDLVAVDPQP